MAFRTVSFIFVWIYFVNSAHGLQKLSLFMKFREKFYCASSALEISNYQLRKAPGKRKCGIRPSQIGSAVIFDVFHFWSSSQRLLTVRLFSPPRLPAGCWDPGDLGVHALGVAAPLSTCVPEWLQGAKTPFTTPTPTREESHQTSCDQEINVYDVKSLRLGVPVLRQPASPTTCVTLHSVFVKWINGT